MKGVSGVFKVSFKSVSRVLKGSFMGVSVVFVFIEVIAATRAYGGLVFRVASFECTILFQIATSAQFYSRCTASARNFSFSFF